MLFFLIHKMLKQQRPFELPLQDSCFILHPATARTHTRTLSPRALRPLSVPPWLGDFGSERTSSWCGICSTSVIVCWTKLFLWVELLSGLPPYSLTQSYTHTHIHVSKDTRVAPAKAAHWAAMKTYTQTRGRARTHRDTYCIQRLTTCAECAGTSTHSCPLSRAAHTQLIHPHN